ncbi:MAG: cyclase family protein [Marinilabiliaceae bacterium]|nr:cyclase family protein [Marinilabiliaceae bacterium]
MQYIDLTHKITSNMPVFPGDKKNKIIQLNTIDNDGFSNYQLTTGMHIGTHIDGPLHMLTHKKYIGDIDISNFIGKGILIDHTKELNIDQLSSTNFHNKIAIIYTRHYKHFHTQTYFTKYPIITPKLIDFLIDSKVKIIAIDTPSPDYYPFHTHKKIFNAGICLVENITNLEPLKYINHFNIIALPLKIETDSSPLRVVAQITQH